jgi:hypothetical protein
VSLQLEFGGLELPRDERGAAERGPLEGGSWIVAFGTPPLGVSYYRVHEGGLTRTGGLPPIPEDMAIARLTTHHVGVTVLQTVADRVHLGAALKYVRGTAASGVATATTSEEIRTATDALPDQAEGTFDVDVGVHGTAGILRAGVVVRNALEPSFGSPSGEELVLGRQVRVGLALAPGPGWTVAVDVDLLDAESATGTWRRAAAGVERWSGGRRVGLRGGLRTNTRGPSDPVVSVGASLGLTPILFAEGHVTLGAAAAEQMWGASLRLAF